MSAGGDGRPAYDLAHGAGLVFALLVGLGLEDAGGGLDVGGGGEMVCCFD